MNQKKVLSYRPAWESQNTWIKRDKNPNRAFCKVCQVSFWIDNSSLSQVKTHGSTEAHKGKETLLSGKTSQSVLVSKDNGISLSRESFTLSLMQTHCKLWILFLPITRLQAQSEITIS